MSLAVARRDVDLAKAVRQSVEWDTRVPRHRVRWSVSHGVVTLDGVLASRREREDAQRAFLGVCGVEGVVNRIAIASEARTVDASPRGGLWN